MGIFHYAGTTTITANEELDSLGTEYPDTFKCVGETDIDKTYLIPKTAVTYRKPRRISEAKREQA